MHRIGSAAESTGSADSALELDYRGAFFKELQNQPIPPRNPMKPLRQHAYHTVTIVIYLGWL
jgi:hypothetical protein